jgi:hypothetical protein
VPDALADVPLAIFAALAAYFLAVWIVGRRASSLVLFAAFGAFAAWTKNEGTVLVLALGVVAAIASASRRASTILPPLVATAVALGATLPWRLWTAAHDVHVDTPLSEGLHPSYLGDRLSRAGTISVDFGRHLGTVHSWFAAPYLLLGLSAVVFAAKSRRLAIYAVAAPLAAFVLFVWAYMIRNDPLGVHWLLNTSSSRTTMSIGLVALVLAFFELAMLLAPRARTTNAVTPAARTRIAHSEELPTPTSL